jgi:iron(III) transport system ATP-binding protein
MPKLSVLANGSKWLKGQVELAAGCYALFGPSGAGKTTWFRVVSGLERLDGVCVGWSGQPSWAEVPAYHRPIAYVPQRPSLIPHRSVRAQVQWVARVSPPCLDDWARELEMEALWDRLPGALSGGEQQRAAILRALATDPRILLLDEALSQIDKVRRRRILRAILERWPDDRWVIFSTHDWDEVEELAPSVILVERGQLFGPAAIQTLVPPTSTLAPLMGYIGPVTTSQGAFWVHPRHIRLGRWPQAGMVLAGTVRARQKAPALAQYRFVGVDGTVLIWHGPWWGEGPWSAITVAHPVAVDSTPATVAPSEGEGALT